MQTNKYAWFFIGVFLLLCSGQVSAEASSSLAHYGFIESLNQEGDEDPVERVKNKYPGMKLIKISGKYYYFDKNNLIVKYKNVSQSYLSLAHGMKVKYYVRADQADHLVELTVLSSQKDMINQ